MIESPAEYEIVSSAVKLGSTCGGCGSCSNEDNHYKSKKKKNMRGILHQRMLQKIEWCQESHRCSANGKESNGHKDQTDGAHQQHWRRVFLFVAELNKNNSKKGRDGAEMEPFSFNNSVPN